MASTPNCLDQGFPQKGIIAVVRAPSAENAEQATNLLAQALSRHAGLFPLVTQPDSGDFFERNGLLFEPAADVRKTAEGFARMRPVIAALASDPSLRGVAKTLSFAAAGVKGGEIRLEQLTFPLSLADRTLSDVLSGRPAAFSWLELLEGQPLPDKKRRHFLEVQPTLDFSALQPLTAVKANRSRSC